VKRINFILIYLFLLFPITRTFATIQNPDILVYNGDTLPLFDAPLEQLYKNNTEISKLFGVKKGCWTTACYRGYQAWWTIIDQKLYLTGIYSCCYDEDGIKADLKQLFGGKYLNEKVNADWVNITFIVPKGKLLYYLNMGYESIYETQLELQIEAGTLIGSKTYDNSKAHQSEYSKDQIKLAKFIYSNVNWNALPKLGNKEIKVFVQLSANEKGIIDSVKVLRSDDERFNNEAIRVTKKIPEWDIIYKLGKFERCPWKPVIIFSEKNRKRNLK
jgi:hypothetical protein